jgi:hypothetical protein
MKRTTPLDPILFLFLDTTMLPVARTALLLDDYAIRARHPHELSTTRCRSIPPAREMSSDSPTYKNCFSSAVYCCHRYSTVSAASSNTESFRRALALQNVEKERSSTEHVRLQLVRSTDTLALEQLSGDVTLQPRSVCNSAPHDPGGTHGTSSFLAAGN